MCWSGRGGSAPSAGGCPQSGSDSRAGDYRTLCGPQRARCMEGPAVSSDWALGSALRYAGSILSADRRGGIDKCQTLRNRACCLSPRVDLPGIRPSQGIKSSSHVLKIIVSALEIHNI